MASLTKKPLKEVPVEDLGGGLNETNNIIDIRECIVCENFRVADDKKTKEERPGLTRIDSSYDFGTKKVFGIFGIEEEEGVDIAAFLEDEIKLKSGNDWNSIFNPTKNIDKPVSIVQDKGLVFVAGYEKLITLKNGQANYSGIEAPVSAPTVELISSPTDYKAVEYPESNQDNCGKLRSNATQTLLSQSFKLENDYELSKIKIKLRKIGVPTGNLWAEIHQTRSGTSTTKNASPGIVGQGTDNLDVSTLTGSFETKELSFSGTKPNLSKENNYYLVIYSNFSVSSSNFVEVGFDCSSPSYSEGKYWEIDGSLNWLGYSAVDLVFEMYGYCKDELELKSFGIEESGYSYPLRADSDCYLIAQSFKVPSNCEVTKIQLPLKNYGGRSGNLWAEVHSSQSGTSATKGASTNIVGDPSENIACQDIPDDFILIDIEFPDTKPSLTGETTYYLVLYCTLPASESTHIKWTTQEGYDDGAGYEINQSMAWTELTAQNRKDFSFKIFGNDLTEKKAGEYEFDNLDDIKELRENNLTTLLAQEFQVFEASDVTRVKVFGCKVGSPTGYIWAEIHSSQGGTSSSKGLSDGIVGEASDNIDVSTLSTFPNHGWVEFTFSGTKPGLEPNTIYYLVIYGDFTVSTNNFVRVGMDKIDPQYSLGKRWDIDNNLDWTARDSINFIFEVYLATSDLAGDYSFVITFIRGGNYQCESNPSPPSEKITITAGKIFRLSNIPVSDDPEVTHKGIYRNKAGEEKRYWEATVENSITQYDTGVTDDGLGDEVSYENNPPPLGDCVEIWDDHLWVSGVPGYMEGIFRSRMGFLEQFPSTAISYMPLREDQSDKVVRSIEFNNYLYPFKTSSIWVLSRSGESYVIDKIVDGTGTVAGSSIVECHMKEGRRLVFLSNHYRIEIMDGYGNLIFPEISDKVKKTLASINKAYAYRSTAQNYIGRHEIRLAIPTGTSTIPNKVIVFDYLKMNLYVDTHYQNFCSLSTTNLATGQRETIFGTDSGDALKIDEEATNDDGHVINSKFRTGWIGKTNWLRLRKLWLDYILPTDKNLIFKIYSNFRETPDLNIILPGSTPSGTDPTLRDLIHKKILTSINGNFFSFYFANAEDAGGKFKINKMFLNLRIDRAKRTVKAL